MQAMMPTNSCIHSVDLPLTYEMMAWAYKKVEILPFSLGLLSEW